MLELVSYFSVLPVLFAVQLLAIHWAIRHAARRESTLSFGWIYGTMFSLIVWSAVSTWLAFRGVYESAPFLASYPAVWLPLIPVALILIPQVLSASARDSVRALIDVTPVRWIVGIHALRILAIGTLVKAWNGQFSMSFAIFVGIPDMLFGLSAILMVWLALKDRISASGLFAWSIAGVVAIYPGAPIIGQMGLPGPLHAITETPSITTLFDFPMVLGPSLVVPIFIVMNVFVAIRLLERASRPNECLTAA